jgi:type I restriction enzyme S subunit
VLGALDDKIELNRRMNATLEAMARALFQSWFVDFDPVRAKLDPANAGPTPNLAPATAALFPEHFAHGEHDMLPVGWRHAAIEEVSVINAWTLGKNDDLESLEYVEISEVIRGNIANIATYPRGEEPSRARRRLRHGDTVLSTVRPDRGSYFLALNPPENRVASTGFAALVTRNYGDFTQFDDVQLYTAYTDCTASPVQAGALVSAVPCGAEVGVSPRSTWTYSAAATTAVPVEPIAAEAIVDVNGAGDAFAVAEHHSQHRRTHRTPAFTGICSPHFFMLNTSTK